MLRTIIFTTDPDPHSNDPIPMRCAVARDVNTRSCPAVRRTRALCYSAPESRRRR
jgi:hypothetical protein